jgi:hypothetical protein
MLDEADAFAVPFICDCPREGCTKVARLSLVEYETVRSQRRLVHGRARP